MEKWVKIKDYEMFEISNLGRIRSVERYVETRGGGLRYIKSTILKTYYNKGGYEVVALRGKVKGSKFVHRLVALMFVPNPNNYETVNHIDSNKKNNKADNLEWMTHQQNNIYSKARAIDQYDLNGNYIRTWNMIKDAADYYKTSHIQEVCSGKANTAKGFIWKVS